MISTACILPHMVNDNDGRGEIYSFKGYKQVLVRHKEDGFLVNRTEVEYFDKDYLDLACMSTMWLYSIGFVTSFSGALLAVIAGH